MNELKKEKIAFEVIKTLKSRFENFPEDASDNRNAPFHEAFLEAFKLKLEKYVTDIPIFVSLSSWMHGLNTTLGQSFFEKTSHILCDGEKREFKDLLINYSQQERINEIIASLKNCERNPNLNEENNLLFSNNGINTIRVPNFSADIYFEDDEKIIAIELKTVKPNSGVFKGEKEKILYAKAGLKNKYPHKDIRYYLGFPFDPLSEEKYKFDKRRFFNYGIDFKKFFDPDEVLLAEELWDFLSEEKNTMQTILGIINSISTLDFMKKYDFINEFKNLLNEPEAYQKILKNWLLVREYRISQNINIFLKLAKKEKRINRILNQTIFNNKAEYKESRINTLYQHIEPHIQELPKAYNPADVEEKWYSYWLKHNIFHSEIDKSKKPYTIVIPPPNITGSLTMGHILNNTIQDIFIRTKRMQGFNACWVPGTDHASIATESKVVKMLKDQKINKHEIGREEFLKHCWEWKEKYGGIIIQQLKKLGVSCDWQRERFTMDDHYYKKVIEAFVQLYKDGKIYRGFRMVNWDPANKSAISDEEVIYKTVNGKLWYFKYPVKDSDEFITVATTRPETMLGDTGVAINPNDERFKKFIGKKVVLPIVGREIPVFADEYVDMEFGTGAVKVTPAHDVNDYDMGQRHKLEIVNILNDDASLNENAPKEFVGLDRFEARKKVVEKIEQLGLLAKVDDYQNKVGYSERGHVPIEPYLSEQWFMSMSEFAESAIQVVKDGKVNYHPNHWVKTYEHWMSNIKDWCISRQLWWGHRIPVWYHKQTKEIYCEVEPPKDIENWQQDEDVLDTWASSWLWAHDVFVNDEEQNYYYPTDLLVTAPDIIFFWVARMIMAGVYFKKDIPFKDVYFTSVIRDVQGRKMSKSLGNSPDPLDVIRDYGADALRFTVIYLAPLGQDVLFSADKCEFGRNFSNKIWNAGRFLLMNAQTIPINEKLIDKHIDFSDRWINSRFHQTVSEMNKAMDMFEVNNASKIIYSFVWNDFCDWYIELAKNRLYSSEDEIKSAVLTRAIKMFENLLKIVHPFMPFITEELWQRIYEQTEGESISTAAYPKLDETQITVEAEKEMEFVQDIITAIRNIRGEMNIPPSKSVKAFIKSTSVKDYQLDYIKKLARVEEIQVSETITKTKASASAVIRNCEIYVPLEGLIDIGVEKSRLQKEISRLESLLIGIDKKLSNEKFVSNAAAEVVEKERMKKIDWNENLVKLKELLNNLS